MPYVVTGIGFLPPPREDGVAWTRVKVDEAPAPGGPWTQIDDQALPNPDPDPAHPAARNVTTSLATLALGWYRLTFFDPAGAQSQPSEPWRSSADSSALPPTPDTIRNQSPLLREKFPLPPSDPYALADLRSIVYQATALVQAVTWRLIDPSLGCSAPEGYSCETVPDALISVAYEAVTRMAERTYVQTEPDFAEQLATGRRLRGFSAGPYSEQYFAPGEFARRGAQQGRPPVDPDDALDTALWALMTEDARDYFVWRASGVAPPTGVATAFDYRRQSGGYSAGAVGGLGSRSGPDGF